MTTQTKTEQLADELENTPFQSTRYEAAAELLRLGRIEHAWQMWQDKTEWVQKTSDGHELGMHRADALRQRIERLEAANAELLESLVDVSYTLEKARIWGGMEWKYNPLHPVHYLPARDKARAAIAKHGGAA